MTHLSIENPSNLKYQICERRDEGPAPASQTDNASRQYSANFFHRAIGPNLGVQPSPLEAWQQPSIDQPWLESYQLIQQQ